jgi:hypothetical protein
MSVFSLLELAANSLCLLILWRYRNEDINMTSIGGFCINKDDWQKPIFAQLVISLNLILAELRLGLKNRQVILIFLSVLFVIG